MPARSIAAAQTVATPGDVEANVAQHVRLAHVAADERARVIVFPELSLTGYEIGLADRLAFSEADARLGPLVNVAALRSTTLIVGAPVRIRTRLCIGAFILGPDRSIELYTKHHLGAFATGDGPGGVVPPPEDSVFSPGDRNPLVSFGGNTGALAVCADWTHPSHARAAAERGANTYLTGMFTIPNHLEMASSALATYARRHRMAVVFANHGGPTGGLPAAGRSAIWSPDGHSLVRLEATGLGVAVAHESDAGWRTNAVRLESS